MTLLDSLRNIHSQNGEDGVIARVFGVIGDGGRFCCEFGAWDGLHLSNSRALLEQGWAGCLIESDETKFTRLQSLYENRPDVKCLNAKVGSESPLVGLLGRRDLDFLSIDIDGLDYQAFRDSGVTPRLACVEVNAGHDPDADLVQEEIAAKNVGQPLGAFVDLAATLGYRLIAYTGNAFFLNEAEGHEKELPTLSTSEAYADFLDHLDRAGREWLFKVNLGLVDPHREFLNSYLGPERLGIPRFRAFRLRHRWL